MKDIFFWCLLILIIVSVLYVSQFNIDGFQPKMNIPVTSPPRESLTSGDFTAYAPPSTSLLAPPPGGVASVNALPRADPSLEKSPYIRIKEVLENANGFINNEAPHMAEMSDPSVQLPLTTLKADIRRLNDEDLVLQRNPGIESTLTQHDVDGMHANLVYLQKKWRDTANSTSGMLEGFTDASGNTTPVTLAQLKDLVIRITVEMSRLSGSATTDPITTSRIKTLTTIKEAVQGIVDKVTAKLMKESDIPIMEADYKAFLPVLGTNGTLPTLLKQNNLPPSLSSLFPASLGDISGAGIAQYLFKNYADTLFKGLSWDVHYTSERALDIENAKVNFATAAKAALIGGNISGSNVGSAGSGGFGGGNSYGAAPATTYRGAFAAAGAAGATGDTGATSNIVAGPPATFDWKVRAIAICDAVQKRGYNPGDFGCVSDVNSVGSNFSWRGYSKMVCSRIATIYDTGAPEACGCPPQSWDGWRL